MPIFEFDFPEDEPGSFEGGSGSSYSDERAVEGIGEVKPLRGDTLTHSDLTKILVEELGMSGERARSRGKTINERLKDAVEYAKENGYDLAVTYRKEKPSKRPAKPPARITPSTKKPPKAKTSKPTQQSIPLTEGLKPSTTKRKQYFDKRQENRDVRAIESGRAKLTPEDTEFFDPRVFSKEEIPESMGRGFVITDSMGGALGPPRKPPAPPSGSSSPGDGEDDFDDQFLPGPDEQPSSAADVQAALDPDREKKIRAEQDAVLADAKKRFDRAAKKKRAEAAREFQQRRKRIYAESQRASAEISSSSSAATSGRIVRRLASFGIGRNLGGSGQLFAALMEYAVFRPEEEQTQQGIAAERDKIEKQKADRLRQLEDDIFNLKMQSEEQKEMLEDAVTKARRGLRGTQSIQERDEVLNQLDEDLKRIPTGQTGSPAGRGRGGPGGGSPPPGSSSSGSSGGSSSRGLIGPINTGVNPPGGGGRGGSGGTGGPGPGPGGRGFSFGPIGTTGLILGTLGLTEVIKVLRETEEKIVQSVGKILTIDPLTQSGIAPTLDTAGSAIKGGSRVAGGLTGAAVGTLLLPGLGTALGAAIGASAGGFVDPIVEAVKVGNNLLEQFTRNSLDADTLAENANQQIATFLAKLEADESVSDQTVAFSQAQGRLTRAIIGFQESVVSEFGDAFAQIISLLSILVDVGSAAVSVTGDGMKALVAMLPPQMQFIINGLISGLDTLTDIYSALKDVEDVSPIANELGDFFGTQQQFQVKTGRKTSTRFGTNIGNFIGP